MKDASSFEATLALVDAHLHQLEAAKRIAELLNDPEAIAECRRFMDSAEYLQAMIHRGKRGSSGWEETSKSIAFLILVVNDEIKEMIMNVLGPPRNSG